MKKKTAVITVLDNITETSMPFNEFVLYRSHHHPEEAHILIVCGKDKGLPNVDIPKNLKIIYTGKSLFRIRKTIKGVIQKCKTSDTPYMIHLHQVQSALLAEISMFGTKFRKKVLFTVHNTFTGYSFHNKVLSFVNALFAYRISCVSKTAYKHYPKPVKKIKKDRIFPIQNGVDTERIDNILNNTVKEETKETNNTVDFIYVARMVPVKNHKFLIDVLKKTNQNVRFIFVGQEDEKKEIREYAKENGVTDRLVFTGLIPRNEVFQLLSRSDAYISSSVLEGLPVSVLEAMYCSLPCILSDIPQHKEAGEGAGKEIRILPLETDLWVEEINQYSLLSKEERMALGQRARSFVKDNFSLEKMHRQYGAVYELLQ